MGDSQPRKTGRCESWSVRRWELKSLTDHHVLHGRENESKNNLLRKFGESCTRPTHQSAPRVIMTTYTCGPINDSRFFEMRQSAGLSDDVPYMPIILYGLHQLHTNITEKCLWITGKLLKPKSNNHMLRNLNSLQASMQVFAENHSQIAFIWYFSHSMFIF